MELLTPYSLFLTHSLTRSLLIIIHLQLGSLKRQLLLLQRNCLLLLIQGLLLLLGLRQDPLLLRRRLLLHLRLRLRSESA